MSTQGGDEGAREGENTGAKRKADYGGDAAGQSPAFKARRAGGDDALAAALGGVSSRKKHEECGGAVEDYGVCEARPL